MRRSLQLVLGALLVCFATLTPRPTIAATIVNGSFETGDFFGWMTADISPGSPFDPLAVAISGTSTGLGNVVIPSEGALAATHGFDGDPGTISIAQDIGVIAVGDLLTFDHRAGWDLITFSTPGDLDREFTLDVEPAGGGVALATFPILTAPIGTNTSGGPNSDTGPLSEAIDLSAFAGIDARLSFEWLVPNSFTGPANAQLDNVAISNGVVPEPTALVIWSVLGFLGGAPRGRRKRRGDKATS